jgi:DNA-binding NtrC family response regulator
MPNAVSRVQGRGHDERPTILLVEDNDAIRSLIIAILESGYDVLPAADSVEGIAVATEAAGTICMAVCDVNLAGGSGPALIERIAPLHPGMKTIFISGGPRSDEFDRSDRDVVFLQKPFRPSELRETVERLLSTG